MNGIDLENELANIQRTICERVKDLESENELKPGGQVDQ